MLFFMNFMSYLLPPASTPAHELEQQSKFFVVLTLHELANKYSHVCDQILGSPVIPNFTSTCSTLCCVPCKPLNELHVLASQPDDRNRSRKPGKGRPKCDHCGKLGHKIDRCYALQLVLLNLLLLLKLILPHNHLLWISFICSCRQICSLQ